MDEIEIIAYDPAWPALFEAEAARLRTVLPGGLLLGLEHVGSTAVPGLAAKPVIDIAGVVVDVGEARRMAVEPLAEAGYAFWAENPDLERLFFVRGLPPAPHRTHHLHLMAAGPTLDRHLSFRDRLIARPDTAARYAALKQELAVAHLADREAYTAAKKAFIDAVLAG